MNEFRTWRISNLLEKEFRSLTRRLVFAESLADSDRLIKLHAALSEGSDGLLSLILLRGT